MARARKSSDGIGADTDSAIAAIARDDPSFDVGVV